MIFASYPYFLFLAAVLALLIVVPGQLRRKLLLIGASYYFYAYWDPRFLLLILFTTGFNALMGKAIFSAGEERRKKALLVFSLLVNLGILGFFKYFNFFIESAALILKPLGISVSTLDILLPIGISFFTFEVISYTVDIFRGRTEPAASLTDFALFVAFFPRLIAGPIIRPYDFLPQLQRPIEIRGENVWAGLQIFTVGLFKKLIIADALAPFVDRIFADPGLYSPLTVWLGVIAYTFQIFCDFSGYSDMAIGSARMIGFTFPRNFNMPYVATNLAEFWKRWHISLSTWLRDYLYIPLGGNRKGPTRTQVNLMITMLLGGLWHGASWNFVIWGGINGLGLVAYRIWRKRTSVQPTRINTALAWVGTFLFICLVRVFFRSVDMTTTLAVFRKVFFLDSGGVEWYFHYFFVAALLMVVGHYFGLKRKNQELVFFESPYSVRAAFATTLAWLVIFTFAPMNANPFIYFQF